MISPDDYVCDHDGVECEPEYCVCSCTDCKNAKLDLENEIE